MAFREKELTINCNKTHTSCNVTERYGRPISAGSTKPQQDPYHSRNNKLVLQCNLLYRIPQHIAPCSMYLAGRSQLLSVFETVDQQKCFVTMQGMDNAVQLAGVRDMPKQATSLQIDFSSLLGPLFFEWLMQLLLPVFVFSQVHEKEKSLRVMMKMQGLPDRSACNRLSKFMLQNARTWSTQPLKYGKQEVSMSIRVMTILAGNIYASWLLLSM